jgi:hypothetical protein
MAARGGCAAATTSAGVEVPGLTGATRSVADFRLFLTVIRTRARARAAALEKFIATNNPARGPQQNAFAAAIRCFLVLQPTSRFDRAISTAHVAAQL